MIYFIDHDREDRRVWESLGSDLVAAQLVDGGTRITHSGNDVHDGLVIAHRSAVIAVTGPSGLNRLADSLAQNAQVTLVVVHGDFQTEGSSIHARLYCRRWPIDNPIDAAFQRCWHRFASAFAQGTLAFNLLEPADTPYLTSLAILASAELALPPLPAVPSSMGDCRTGFETWVTEIFDTKNLTEVSEKLRNDMPASAADEIVQMIRDGQATEVRQALDDFFL